jgi:hypothetical protein
MLVYLMDNGEMINHQKGNLIKMKTNVLFCVKIALIVLFMLAGLLLCVNEILGCKVNLWTGVSYILAGFGGAVVVELIFSKSLDFDTPTVIGGCMFLLGVIGIVTQSTALDTKHIDLRSDLLIAFNNASEKCGDKSAVFNNAAQTCALGPVYTSAELIYQLSLAQHLNSSLTVIDGISHAFDKEKVDPCIYNYYKYAGQCPDSFSTIKGKYKELSLEHIEVCEKFLPGLYMKFFN